MHKTGYQENLLGVVKTKNYNKENKSKINPNLRLMNRLLELLF